MLNQANYAFSPYSVPTAVTSVVMAMLGIAVLRRRISRVRIALAADNILLFI